MLRARNVPGVKKNVASSQHLRPFGKCSRLFSFLSLRAQRLSKNTALFQRGLSTQRNPAKAACAAAAAIIKPLAAAKAACVTARVEAARPPLLKQTAAVKAARRC